jgi:hypothetical protein
MCAYSGPTVKGDREYLLRLIVTTFVARMTFVVFAQKNLTAPPTTWHAAEELDLRFRTFLYRLLKHSILSLILGGAAVHDFRV